jgi:hypothetical protein
LGRRGRHNHIALDLHNVTLVDAVDACDDGVDSGPTIYTIKCAGIINDDSVSLMAVLAYQSESKIGSALRPIPVIPAL